MNDIAEITSTGLRYRKDGEVCSVDFEECALNWKEYATKRNIRVASDEKIIGQRNIDAKPRYFEFFSKPFVRIEFFDDENGKSSLEQFRETQEILALGGWKTLDLS